MPNWWQINFVSKHLESSINLDYKQTNKDE